MPNIMSYAGLFREWESLVAACEENADILADINSVKDPLLGILAQARSLKSLQENLEGERQQITQQLRELAEQGREAARRVRGLVKARLGAKSERLPQFGVAPIRKRTRSAKPTEAPPPKEAAQS